MKSSVAYHFLEARLYPPSCDVIIDLARKYEVKEPIVGLTEGGEGLVPELRRCDLRWLPPAPETALLYETIMSVAQWVNSMAWQLPVSGLGSFLQFTEYYEANQGHYGWHADRGRGFERRALSLSVQLSGSADYEGGDLEFKNCEISPEHKAAFRQRGTMIFFPSQAVHRVTQVTKGRRLSLVAWLDGPVQEPAAAQLTQ
jgi:PKHD-type hydroxylase